MKAAARPREPSSGALAEPVPGKRARWVSTAGLLLLACAGKTRGPEPPQREIHIRVRSYSDLFPVRALVVVPPYVFAGSESGLVRWHLDTGSSLQLNRDHGLPGDSVRAMAYDETRDWLWIATDGGITRYEVKSGVFVSPAGQSGEFLANGHTSAATAEGGLWLGTERGLGYVDGERGWRGTPLRVPVTALLRTVQGSLWIGTPRGLSERKRSGKVVPHGPAQGCDLDHVRLLAAAPDGAPLAVGENRRGRQQVVRIGQAGCESFAVEPHATWLDAATRGDSTVILTAASLYELVVRQGSGPSDARQLVAADGSGKASPYLLRRLMAPVPPGAHTVAIAGDELLVGTRTLGTARLRDGPSEAVSWLRRGDLVQGASSLSVACRRRSDCFVATGSKHAWRFRGSRIIPVGDGRVRVLAVAQALRGEIYAIKATIDDRSAAVFRLHGAAWHPVRGAILRVPGESPELTFARFAPSGELWVGLRYRDAAGELHPYGVAVVNVGLGRVAYHHASRRGRRGLPLPPDVVDAIFAGPVEVWFATSQGAVQVRGQDMRIFGEAEGLRSEILRGVARSVAGSIYVASREGVDVFDGRDWTRPAALSSPANDIALGASDHLWMATDRGLALYDRRDVLLLHTRRALVDDSIADLATDRYGRIWVRGGRVISIVTSR